MISKYSAYRVFEKFAKFPYNAFKRIARELGYLNDKAISANYHKIIAEMSKRGVEKQKSLKLMNKIMHPSKPSIFTNSKPAVEPKPKSKAQLAREEKALKEKEAKDWEDKQGKFDFFK